MFTPNLEGYCSPSTSPQSICSPSAPIVLPFRSPCHTMHGSRHAGTAATPFLSCVSAQFPSHMGVYTPAKPNTQLFPVFSTTASLRAHSNSRNSNPFRYLLHSSLYTGETGLCSRQISSASVPPPGGEPIRPPLQTLSRKTHLRLTKTPFFLQLSTFDFRLFEYNPRTSLRGTNEL